MPSCRVETHSAVTLVLGTTDNFAVDLRVAGSRVMRYEPNAVSPNVVGGHPTNSVGALFHGETVSGGGYDGTNCFDLPTGRIPGPAIKPRRSEAARPIARADTQASVVEPEHRERG